MSGYRVDIVISMSAPFKERDAYRTDIKQTRILVSTIRILFDVDTEEIRINFVNLEKSYFLIEYYL